MNRMEAAEYALRALEKTGAEKRQVIATVSEKDELTVDRGEFSLFRTTLDPGLSLKAIQGGRVGVSRVNIFAKEAIDKAVDELKGLIDAAAPDAAHDISPKASGSFKHGPAEADREKMLGRTQEYLDEIKANHPRILLRTVNVDFTRTETTLLNSNGTELHSSSGAYALVTGVSGQEGGKSSSFNYAYGLLKEIDQRFMNCLGNETLLKQSAEQVNTKPVPEKFEGELIITPQCLPSLLRPYLSHLADDAMIAGTSLFKDKLGERIASPLLNIATSIRNPEFASHEFFDGQGFLSEDMQVISEGVLKSFLLSLYGANKTGKAKAKSTGSNLVMAGGQKSLEDLIGSVKRGVLLCRFSGGMPSENGDFSGVAKNSYYIEDGKIQFPVSETMVSGNLVSLFREIKDLSKDRFNSGSTLYPWLQVGGVTVSGK